MATTMSAPRNPYLDSSVSTASPGRLLVMLYDRLVLDLGQAEEALRAGDRETGSLSLMHAQDIVMELRGTLDTSVWDGAAGLAALYSFLFSELIRANVKADADVAASCRTLVEPLRDAWREATLAPMPVG
jgi:flagellar secretion chaperone FliS